jgi:hypothetical protein
VAESVHLAVFDVGDKLNVHNKITPVPHLEVILYRVYGCKVPNVLHIGIT